MMHENAMISGTGTRTRETLSAELEFATKHRKAAPQSPKAAEHAPVRGNVAAVAADST